METGKDKQTRLVGPPDARKRACPVRGALDGNLMPQGSKALSFDSMTLQEACGARAQEVVKVRLSAQPAADWSAQRLVRRRRWAAPAAGWAARHCFLPPVGSATWGTLPHPSAPQGAWRCAAGVARGTARHLGIMQGQEPPQPPPLGSAPRKVGRPPRASAAGAASARCGGRPFQISAPRPPRAVAVLGLQPPTPRGLRSLRAAPALPLPPRGRPGDRKPQPGPAE